MKYLYKLRKISDINTYDLDNLETGPKRCKIPINQNLINHFLNFLRFTE